MKSVRMEDHTVLDILSRDSVVFDFGGNEGRFARGMIERYGCRVFSAEPVPILQTAFPTNPQLTLFPVALAGRSGTLRLNVFPNRCATLEKANPEECPSEVIEVEAITFAEFRRRTGIERVNLLKFDIEGAELDVFASMSDEDIQRADQITVEFHEFVYPETAPLVAKTIDRISKNGFHVIRYSKNTGDVLFVNRRLKIKLFDIVIQRTIVKYSRGLSRILKRKFLHR